LYLLNREVCFCCLLNERSVFVRILYNATIYNIDAVLQNFCFTWLTHGKVVMSICGLLFQ
jgi:hypothetical protein